MSPPRCPVAQRARGTGPAAMFLCARISRGLTALALSGSVSGAVDFLEIAALRRILLSGVSVTRHVMGLVHPISIFTTKNFDGIFW